VKSETAGYTIMSLDCAFSDPAIRTQSAKTLLMVTPFFKIRAPYDSVSRKDTQLWAVKSDAVVFVLDR